MRTVPDDLVGRLNSYSFFWRGRYYCQNQVQVQGTNRAITANRLYASPFYLGPNIKIDRLGIYVSTGIANAKAKVAIYTNRPGGLCLPDKLIAESSEFGCGTSGAKEWQTMTPSQYLRLNGRRVYWLAFISDSAITVQVAFCAPWFLGFHYVENGTPEGVAYLYADQAYGSMPSVFPAIANFGTSYTDGRWGPAVYFRIAPDPEYTWPGNIPISMVPGASYMARTGDIGLVGGGSSPIVSEIDGINFPTETWYDVSAVLSVGRDLLSSFNSSPRGYWAGGNTGSQSSEIDGIIFASEAATNPAATLAVARYGLGGVNSSTRGYCGGGYSSVGGVKNEIDGLQFSDETAINPAAILALARYWMGDGVNSSAKGYWGGGRDGSFINQSEIDGIQFADETAINPAVTLITARYGLSGLNSSTKGYWGGGYSTVYEGEIDGINFADETQVNPVATLSDSYRYCLAGLNSTTRGYWLGGYNAGKKGDIDGIQFSDETAINPSATITARERLAGCQSGGIL